jgi:hypothetical protein
MKITATKTFEAEICAAEVKRITLQCIRAAVGWKPEHYVADGKLYITRNMSTSHSWTEEILVGEATSNDLAAQRVINQILQS